MFIHDICVTFRVHHHVLINYVIDNPTFFSFALILLNSNIAASYVSWCMASSLSGQSERDELSCQLSQTNVRKERTEKKEREETIQKNKPIIIIKQIPEEKEEEAQ
jgi:hypothetical protein